MAQNDKKSLHAVIMIDRDQTGVPDGAARQKSRSLQAEIELAGKLINMIDVYLVGIFLNI